MYIQTEGSPVIPQQQSSVVSVEEHVLFFYTSPHAHISILRKLLISNHTQV